MNASDIESLERATVAAVAPEFVEELAGWLVPLDSGTVSRARSAVPLAHRPAAPGIARQIEERYRAHDVKAAFRLAVDPCFDGLRQDLLTRGYTTDRPVLVQVGSAERMRDASAGPPAEIDQQLDSAWAQLFLGEGFDPVDGASRVRSLSRAHGSVFASVREGGRTLAAGAGAFSHGWASVHGMRTDLHHRGQGLAGRVLHALGERAVQVGLSRIFLQVEAQNAPARALYGKTGFETVWRYEYWRQP